MASTNYINIPPDSTGKSIKSLERIILGVVTPAFTLSDYVSTGEIIKGQSSNATGEFTGYNLCDGAYHISVKNVTGTFVEGENIIHIDSDTVERTIGLVSEKVDLYTQTVNVGDPNYPNQFQHIDEHGSGQVRFRYGDMGFDAFGNAQMSQIHTMGHIDFVYQNNTLLFSDVESGGTITHDSASSMINFSVNNTSGSIVSRQTKTYYPYVTGEGIQTIMTLRMGDAGKDGCVRRWGLFDNEDGLFFELSGSNFTVNIRTSVPGGTNQKVEWIDFSGDSLDNASISDFIIDFSKINLYWIDYQWLGAGRVRFGVVSPDGGKIVLHRIENANRFLVPYMKRSSFPVRWEMRNISGTASTSEMAILCATIQKQGQDHGFESNGRPFVHSSNGFVSCNTGSYTPLLSFRLKDTIGGLPNKTIIYPQVFEYYSDTHPIEVDLFIGNTLVSSSFSQSEPFSNVDIDRDATETTGGIRRVNYLQPQGVSVREIDPNMWNVSGINEDGTKDNYTVAAKSLGDTDTRVRFLIKWLEIN